MSYLLDTHAFLWTLFEPAKLGLQARQAIQAVGHQVFVSAVSFLEISLKVSLAKLILPHCSPDDLLSSAKKLEIELLNLSPTEAASFYRLPKTLHKDPFDRMIAWQAMQNRLTLVTKDGELESYKKMGLQIVW